MVNMRVRGIFAPIIIIQTALNNDVLLGKLGKQGHGTFQLITVRDIFGIVNGQASEPWCRYNP